MSQAFTLQVNAGALRRHRLERALTQQDLARAAGVDRVTVARIEAGRTASARTVRRIADALGVQVTAIAAVEGSVG